MTISLGLVTINVAVREPAENLYFIVTVFCPEAKSINPTRVMIAKNFIAVFMVFYLIVASAHFYVIIVGQAKQGDHIIMPQYHSSCKIKVA
jgi:hypothetical protein